MSTSSNCQELLIDLFSITTSIPRKSPLFVISEISKI